MGATAAGEPPRACTHIARPHTHGSRAAYVADRCRCPACRDANTRAERTRRRARLYQRPGPSIDAGPVREHVLELERAGVGIARIAALAGISRSTMSRLLWGVPSRCLPPTVRLRRDTAQALLAITADEDNRAGGSLVNATGTRRRLQALITLGWTMSALARELERSPSSLRAVLRRQAVTRDTARAVRVLYEQLSIAPPEPASRTRLGSTTDELDRAGWLPPMAWDDIDDDPEPADPDDTAQTADVDDLDIEIAIERVTSGRTVILTDAERDELVDRLTRRGHSLQQIAGYLHVSARTISRRRRALRVA